MNTAKASILILPMALTISLASAAARADSSAAEATGLGSGLVIGAVAGGPPGAIIGAALGGWMGDRFHREHAQRLQLGEELEHSRNQTVQLSQRVEDLQRQVDARVDPAQLQQALSDVLADAVDVNVAFRTEQAQPDPGVNQRLVAFAGLMQRFNNLQLLIEGYADARGTPEFNLSLSEQRAEAVRQVLMNAGIDPARITTVAHGETMAATEDQGPDSMALDRRVTIRLLPEPAGPAVANSE